MRKGTYPRSKKACVQCGRRKILCRFAKGAERCKTCQGFGQIVNPANVAAVTNTRRGDSWWLQPGFYAAAKQEQSRMSTSKFARPGKSWAADVDLW